MRCKYIRKIFQNEENGYTVALFSTLDHEVPLSARDKFWADKKIIAFTAKGYDLPLTDEIEIEMEGEWETNSHGTQYKVETFLEVVPRTREGILGYLSCGSLKGIGPKTAERIVDRFGLDTLEVMEKYPQELLKIQGISQKKLDRIVDSFGKNKAFRELMTFLSPFHVTPKKANMILQKFRDQSVEIIRKQPYILCSVKGFGFLTVDAIARQCCAATNDPMRISGCVSYVLREAMKQNGHLYLEQEILVKDALKVLNKEPDLQPVTETEILKVLYRLVMQDSIVVEENRVYITQQHQEEEDTASMIARKLHERIPVLTIEKELEEAQEDLNITLSEQQKEAVRMVFANPISIITGGPGTGKTTVLKIILYIYQKKCGNEVKLMAPTGRAARRMAESTGSGDATTMHMALGLFGDGDYEALIDELSADFINVDEVSMVDMHLAYEFFYKVKAGARVLLVGDVHQLPSVGAGDVFRQLILCGKIPVTVLNLVYRQGKDSNIPINAQLINEGKTNLQWGDDFQMVECSGADAAAQIVKNIYLKEIQMYGMEQVQILSPYKVRSAAGVLELNRSLQDEVNPPVSGKRELHLGGEIFREGDRILQNKNTEFASNGDLGTLVQIAKDEDNNPLVQIVFTDGRRVKYEAEQVEMIEHANAITIHKSQGSECQVVIIPWLKAFYPMLKRNIFYTGITRAKQRVYIVGEWKAVCQAIHTDDTGTRKTMLAVKIQQYCERYQRQENRRIPATI
ncbi:ATP-dependent RecD-like DNA helicase [Blautia caecimuris]|uniref:SF1B family DNA helicase RecD2 n=1 Tax=Blautia caecimuris TaxID=1796615 RepID=UPI0034C4C7A0